MIDLQKYKINRHKVNKKQKYFNLLNINLLNRQNLILSPSNIITAIILLFVTDLYKFYRNIKRRRPSVLTFLKCHEARVPNREIIRIQKNFRRCGKKTLGRSLFANSRIDARRRTESQRKKGKKRCGTGMGLKEECFGRVLLPRCKGSLLASAHSCRVTIYNRPPFLLLAVLRLRKIIKRPSPSFLLFFVLALILFLFPLSVSSYGEINTFLSQAYPLSYQHRREFASFPLVIRFSHFCFLFFFSDTRR